MLLSADILRSKTCYSKGPRILFLFYRSQMQTKFSSVSSFIIATRQKSYILGIMLPFIAMPMLRIAFSTTPSAEIILIYPSRLIVTKERHRVQSVNAKICVISRQWQLRTSATAVKPSLDSSSQKLSLRCILKLNCSQSEVLKAIARYESVDARMESVRRKVCLSAVVQSPRSSEYFIFQAARLTFFSSVVSIVATAT